MEFGKNEIGLDDVLNATAHNREHMEAVDRAAVDLDKPGRMKALRCRVCYYLRQDIGGAVCSQRPCGGPGCATVVHSGNTCVDLLCPKCAERYGLCRRCAGDLGDKNRTKLERAKK